MSEIVVLPKEQWDLLLSKIDQLTRQISNLQSNEWMDEATFMEKFGVTKKQIYNWQKEHKIVVRKVGQKRFINTDKLLGENV